MPDHGRTLDGLAPPMAPERVERATCAANNLLLKVSATGQWRRSAIERFCEAWIACVLHPLRGEQRTFRVSAATVPRNHSAPLPPLETQSGQRLLPGGTHEARSALRSRSTASRIGDGPRSSAWLCEWKATGTAATGWGSKMLRAVMATCQRCLACCATPRVRTRP